MKSIMYIIGCFAVRSLLFAGCGVFVGGDILGQG